MELSLSLTLLISRVADDIRKEYGTIVEKEIRGEKRKIKKIRNTKEIINGRMATRSASSQAREAGRFSRKIVRRRS